VPPSTRVLIAQLTGIGRDVPLSAEKLSPILAFYSSPNLAVAIGICVRLLEHGGAGHTASIHSQSEAAVKQYGLAVPAFRIAVNTSSVHGSIGYSTNLFPAMTLGCGSPGGNITSDNIGPQHLMNVKRVAWESRPVEHRTIPADQRLIAMPVPMQKSVAASAGASGTPTSSGSPAAGFSGAVGFSGVGFKGLGSSVAGAPSFAPSAKGGGFDSDLRQGTASAVPKASTTPGALAPEAGRDLSAVGSSVAGAPSFASSAKGGDFDSDLRQGTASAMPKASTNPGALAPEAISWKSTLCPIVAAAAALAPVPDRQTIARIVEQVFTARGIPRRGISSATPNSKNLADAGAFAGAPSFASSAKGEDSASDVRQGTAFYPEERRAAVPKSDSEKGASAPEALPPKPAPTSSPTPHPLPPPVEVAEFLSENDVRMALTRNRKLYIGPKTILTPSARDLGNEHEIFIMTDIVPAAKKRRSES
jgi:hypothetical protein